MSDGRVVQLGVPYWVKVEPIIWLVDEKSNIALSKKIIFSGIQFSDIKNCNVDFQNSFIKFFMDNFVSKEIIPSNIDILEKTNSKKRLLTK